MPGVQISPPVAVEVNAIPVQFSANEPVDWSVDGGAQNGYIDATGKYTPATGANQANRQIVIIARSKDGQRESRAYLTGIHRNLGGIGVIHF
jgi:hypothetical protein